MKRFSSRFEYSTSKLSNNSEGWDALELSRSAGETTERVARLTFWDAEGQFQMEMYGPGLPLVIVEEFIAEAKTLVSPPRKRG